MTFTIGIPLIGKQEIFLETLLAIEKSSAQPDRVIVIDNGDVPRSLSAHLHVVRPHRNLGVAASWNLIHKLVAPQTAVIINDDCAVAPDTLQKMLDVPIPAMVLAYGFACFRIDEEIWKRVGEFDESFYPAYWEDADFCYRAKLAGVPIVEWETYPRTVVSLGREQAVSGIVHGKHDPEGYQGWRGEKLQRFHDNIEANKQRYVKKWGGEIGRERFTQPFGEM